MIHHTDININILPYRVLMQIHREQSLVYLVEQTKPILIDLSIQAN